MRVAAASINPVDYKIVEGTWTPRSPCCGRWCRAGTSPARWSRWGRRSATSASGRTSSATRGRTPSAPARGPSSPAVPVRGVATAPSSLDAVGASCLPLAGLTAWQSLVEVLEVQQGETVLVNAASGGVGPPRRPDRGGPRREGHRHGQPAQRTTSLRDLGGEPVPYGEGFVDAVRDLAPDGVHAVADFVGGDGAGGRARPAARARALRVDRRRRHRLRLGGTYVFVRPRRRAAARARGARRHRPAAARRCSRRTRSTEVRAAVEEAKGRRARQGRADRLSRRPPGPVHGSRCRRRWPVGSPPCPTCCPPPPALLARTARAQRDGRVPALVAGVARDGGLAWSAGHGDFAGPAEDVQYRIGSLTKTITAVTVLRLRDEGALGLDDPLERHLPGTPLGDRTIGQLLAHLGGVTAESPGQWWERTPGGSLDDLGLSDAGPCRRRRPPLPLLEPRLRPARRGRRRCARAGLGRRRPRRGAAPLGMDRTTPRPVAPGRAGVRGAPLVGDRAAASRSTTTA